MADERAAFWLRDGQLRLATKRCFDALVATLLLVAVFPVMAVVALLVYIDKPGPIFYRARRVGRNGTSVDVLKFRKMHETAGGRPLTLDDDERFTRIGRWLSKLKLDELPQLVNVLKGEMSLVGPRPEDPDFVKRHADRFSLILSVRPGITGLSQLAYFEEGQILNPQDPVRHYEERILPQKLELDALYVRRGSLLFDLRILYWTLKASILHIPVAVDRSTGRMTARRRPERSRFGVGARPIPGNGRVRRLVAARQASIEASRQKRATSAVGSRDCVRPPEGVYGWLGTVAPAGARRFRVADPALAQALLDAGAEIVQSGADVEIAPAHELLGDAQLSIAVLGVPPGHESRRFAWKGRMEPPLPLRIGSRVGRSARVRTGVWLARRRMRKLGHGAVWSLLWDDLTEPAFATQGVDRARPRIARRLPLRGLVVGTNFPVPPPTLLDAALASAGQAVGEKLEPRTSSVRNGVVMVETNAGILRLAPLHGRVQLLDQRRALRALRSSQAAALVERCVPWELAGGACGIAEWSLERILTGVRPKRQVTGRLLSDCMDFLVALHGAPAPGGGERELIDQAEQIAAACSTEGARSVRRLGRRLQQRLHDVPRGFGHGDFFYGNLLADGGRLAGVVDWEAAGPARLPLLDLLHLRLTSIGEVGEADWGPQMIRHLLPLANTGGDAAIRDYCLRVALDPDPPLLLALVGAYWLGYASHQLRSRPHRRRQPGWVERNLELVLPELSRALGLV